MCVSVNQGYPPPQPSKGKKMIPEIESYAIDYNHQQKHAAVATLPAGFICSQTTAATTTTPLLEFKRNDLSCEKNSLSLIHI